MNIIERLRTGGQEASREAARRARYATSGRQAGTGWLGRIAIAVGGVLAGAGLALLFDPTRGRTRRSRLGDQAAAMVRRGIRGTERATRRARGEVGGRIAALQHANGEGDPFPDDVTLASRVQTELFRDASVPKGTINVNVERGIVVLRGEVPDDAMRGTLVSRVEAMPGVWAVRNLLHLPDEVASAESVASA